MLDNDTCGILPSSLWCNRCWAALHAQWSVVRGAPLGFSSSRLHACGGIVPDPSSTRSKHAAAAASVPGVSRSIHFILWLPHLNCSMITSWTAQLVQVTHLKSAHCTDAHNWVFGKDEGYAGAIAESAYCEGQLAGGHPASSGASPTQHKAWGRQGSCCQACSATLQTVNTNQLWAVAPRCLGQPRQCCHRTSQVPLPKELLATRTEGCWVSDAPDAEQCCVTCLCLLAKSARLDLAHMWGNIAP